MLNVSEATAIAAKAFKLPDILPPVQYQDLYIFRVFSADPDEGDFDPYYSVDWNTGELKPYSMMRGDSLAIGRLFLEQERSGR